MKKFWMLYNPKKHTPQYIHQDFNNALVEAKRLVIKEFSPIVVLEAIGEIKPLEVPTQFVKYSTEEKLTEEEIADNILYEGII